MSPRIEISRQTNFIMALLFIHFAFFGYICFALGSTKDIGDSILFLDDILFGQGTWFSLVILVLIILFLSTRENFFEYAIRNALWLVPFILLESWMWFWLNEGFNVNEIGVFFARYDGYFTILLIVGINIITSIGGVILKQAYWKYIMQKSTELSGIYGTQIVKSEDEET